MKKIFKLPKPDSLPNLNLDVELFRRNVMIAETMILSGLFHGNQSQREKILKSTKREYFSPHFFKGFLFGMIVNGLKDNHEIELSVDFLIEQIDKYYSDELKVSPDEDKAYLRDILFVCAQLLNMHPSDEQVEKAIELRKLWASDKNLIE